MSVLDLRTSACGRLVLACVIGLLGGRGEAAAHEGSRDAARPAAAEVPGVTTVRALPPSAAGATLAAASVAAPAPAVTGPATTRSIVLDGATVPAARGTLATGAATPAAPTRSIVIDGSVPYPAVPDRVVPVATGTPAQAATSAPSAAVTPPSATDWHKPLTLADAVAVALSSSPRVSVANLGVTSAAASATQVRAGELPSLQLTGDWQRGRSSGGSVGTGTSAGGRTTDTYQAQVLLSQTFYQTGLHEQVAAARSAVAASRSGLDDTRRQLALEVAQGYFAALADRVLVEVARHAVATSTEHLAAANARIRAGTTAEADRYPFEVELAQAQVQLIAAENNAKVALTDLKLLMGLPIQAELSLADELGRPALRGALDALVRQAYAARPDVLQQQARVVAARLSLRAAQMARGPVVNATGEVGYGDYDGDTSSMWQVRAGVSPPIFDGNLTRAGADKARAELATQEENLRATRLSVGADVERSYLSAVEANARIDAAVNALGSARVSLGAAQGKYLAGVGTVVEVTDAELKLRQAESEHVQALYDYNTSLAALKAAVGGSPVAALN